VSYPSSPTGSRQPPRRWWFFWGVALGALGAATYVVAATPIAPPARNPFLNLVSIVPLFVSIVIRWLVLPRYSEARKAFPMFLGGLVLALAAGMIGLLGGGPYRGDFAFLASLGVLQFLPYLLRFKM
jgi:hypothetical protein